MKKSGTGLGRWIAPCLLGAAALLASGEASAAKPSPAPPPPTEPQYRAALATMQRGDAAEAMNAFTRLLDDPSVREERKRAVREKILPALSKKTARIVIDPSDATVKIDGREAPTVAGVVYVPPGQHAVIADTFAKHIALEVEALAGKTTLVVVPTPPPFEPPMPPPRVDEPPPPRVEEPAPPPPKPALPTAPVSRPPVALTVGLVGLAVAAAATGTWLVVASNADRKEASKKPGDGEVCYGPISPTCAEADDLTKSADRELMTAVGLFAGAGAFAVSAILAQFVWPTSEAGFRVDAAVTAHAVTAGGSVRF